MQQATQMIDMIIAAADGYTIETYLEEKGITSKTMRRLLNTEEALLYLGGLSRMSLHRRIKSGEIKPVRIGSRTLFDPGDLDKFIEKHKKA